MIRPKNKETLTPLTMNHLDDGGLIHQKMADTGDHETILPKTLETSITNHTVDCSDYGLIELHLPVSSESGVIAYYSVDANYPNGYYVAEFVNADFANAVTHLHMDLTPL